MITGRDVYFQLILISIYCRKTVWTMFTQRLIWMGDILCQLVSMGSLNTIKFTHPPQNTRGLLFELCNLTFMRPQKLNPSPMFLICHQRNRLYGMQTLESGDAIEYCEQLHTQTKWAIANNCICACVQMLKS